jgi:hypothetical protein
MRDPLTQANAQHILEVLDDTAVPMHAGIHDAVENSKSALVGRFLPAYASSSLENRSNKRNLTG